MVSIKKQRNILLIIIFLLSLVGGFAYNRLNTLNVGLNISKQNIKSLSDTIRVNKNKIGNLVFSKNILVIESKNLKKLNLDLHNEVKKERGKVREIIKLVPQITLDTLYLTNKVVKYNDTTYGLSWSYDTLYTIDNERHISGVSNFNLDTNNNIIPLKTIINRDEIKLDLITGLKEKNGDIEIFVRSNHPNLIITQLDGAIIDPKKHPVIKKFSKQKKWGFGPYIGFGLSTKDITLSPQFGIGISYSIIRF